MRSEKVSCAHWDLLTLNTLIEDSDDCLSAAIGVKKEYMNYVWKTTTNAIEQQNYLENFDSKLDIVFQNYLSYIRHWAQAATHNNDVELEWCERVIVTMKSEWERGHSASVSRGEASAAQLFCRVGKDLLNRIVLSYLDEKMFSAGKELEYDFQEFEGEAGLMDEIGMDDEEEDESFYSSVFVFCRDIREMIRHLRERALKSIT
uniref:Uncharacterized protein n=2 Tax=Panagrolaimus superbus TaxID=310955 RepID=A0A914YM54_9BILA